MKIKYNFISAVTLGAFNPAILTPEFILEQEIWSETEVIRSNKTPVFSEIQFVGASFSAELQRFQVISRNPEKFGNEEIINAACRYVQILLYTPVHVQGVNFNINLTDFHDNEIIRNLFDDPENEFSKLISEFKEVLLDMKTSISEGRREVISFNCKYYLTDYSSISISFTKQEEKIRVNYNFEVTGINKNKDRLNLVCRDYEVIYKGYVNFERLLKGETTWKH